MSEYPKRIKRQLRELAAEAYERELERELKKLDQSFEEWRQDTIGSGELSYRVHQYETGPSRELHKRYNSGRNDINVAYAIVVGILDEEEVPKEVMDAIARAMSFYQSLKDTNELQFPE